jgi:secondary thiamine-phosphate synthase enzyme
VVYCPHTTAAITVNENADPDVAHDILACLKRSIPQRQPDFRHGEENSDSHIKASLVGPSVTLIVDQGDLVLGRWQGVFFCEFDGPRTRTVHVQVLSVANR